MVTGSHGHTVTGSQSHRVTGSQGHRVRWVTPVKDQGPRLFAGPRRAGGGGMTTTGLDPVPQSAPFLYGLSRIPLLDPPRPPLICLETRSRSSWSIPPRLLLGAWGRPGDFQDSHPVGRGAIAGSHLRGLGGGSGQGPRTVRTTFIGEGSWTPVKDKARVKDQGPRSKDTGEGQGSGRCAGRGKIANAKQLRRDHFVIANTYRYLPGNHLASARG